MVFIMAYVEAVCYLGLFQTLTGYISGATILLAVEIFQENGEVVPKIMVLITFVPGTFIWVILKEHCSGWRYFGPMLFVIEAGLLTLYMVIATRLSPLIGSEEPGTMVIIVISVLAMSLHNVHSLQVMPKKAEIAITGHFGKFASSTVHLLALVRTCKPTTSAMADFKQLFLPLVAFFGGAFFGAFGFSSLGFIALIFPITTLIIMAAVSFAGSRADRVLS